jgi:hypothetical protein
LRAQVDAAWAELVSGSGGGRLGGSAGAPAGGG